MSEAEETLATCREERDQLRAQVALLTELKQPMLAPENALNGQGENRTLSMLWKAREETERLQDLGVKVLEAVMERSSVSTASDLMTEQIRVVSLRNKSLAEENSNLKREAKEDQERIDTATAEGQEWLQKCIAARGELRVIQAKDEDYTRDRTAQAELITAKTQMTLLRQNLEDERAATVAAARKGDGAERELLRLKEKWHDIEKCKKDVTAAQSLAVLDQLNETRNPAAVPDILKEQIEAVRLRNKQLRDELTKLKADDYRARHFHSDTRRTVTLTDEVARLKGKIAEMEVSAQLSAFRSNVDQKTELKRLRQAMKAELASSQTEREEHDRVREQLETAKDALNAQQTVYEAVLGALESATTELSAAQEAVRQAEQATAQAVSERTAKEQELQKLKTSHSTFSGNGQVPAGQQTTENSDPLKTKNGSKSGGTKGGRKGGNKGNETSSSGITKPESDKPRKGRMTEAERLLHDQSDWFSKPSLIQADGPRVITITASKTGIQTRGQKRKIEAEEQERKKQKQAGATSMAATSTKATFTVTEPEEGGTATTRTNPSNNNEAHRPSTVSTASGSLYSPGEAPTVQVLGRPSRKIVTMNASMLQPPPPPPSPMSPKPSKRKNLLDDGARIMKRARIY